MASRKQEATTAKIALDKAQARFNRALESYQGDPENTRKRNNYRDAKTELAAARTRWRAWRIENPAAADAIAKPPTIAATARTKQG